MLKILFNQSPNAVAILDTQYAFLAATPKWRSDFHLESVTLEEKNWIEIFPLNQSILALFDAALSGVDQPAVELQLTTDQGFGIWVRCEIRPWRREDKSIGGIIVFAYNQEAHRKLTERLRIEQEQFEGAFVNSAMGWLSLV